MQPSKPTVARSSRLASPLAAGLITIGLHLLVVTLSLNFPASFGYSAKHPVHGDISIYHGFAAPFLEGRLPYRDYRVEYPILAMPVFLLPLIAGKTLATYQIAFITEMMVVDLFLVALIAWRTASRHGAGQVWRALGWYSAFFLALCPLVVTRYDLVPTLLGFLAALAMTSGRMGWGGFWAALGILTKLVPVVILVPLLAIPGSLKARGKSLAVLGVTVTTGFLAWWWLGGSGLVLSFRYHGERGLEIESLPALGYLLAHKLFDVLIAITFDHGGANVGGPGARDAARLAPIVQGALLLLVAGRARQSRTADGLRLAAATLLAYIIAGKVLSPQYLIWLFPFLATLEGRGTTFARCLFLVCCVLTTAIYPHNFEALLRMKPWPIYLLAVRNLGLVWLFVILLGKRTNQI